MRPVFCPIARALPAAALCAALASCAPAESRSANSIADSTIGVVQCDQYMAQISACLQQVPAGRRPALTAQARETFVTWKQAAAHPQHRQALPQACQVTHELAREELAPLGCSM
jgi:hypothetical protein